MPHQIISKIDADISNLEILMSSLEDQADSDILKKFELARTYFALGTLHELKEDNNVAGTYFNDARIEFDELLQQCEDDIVFVQQYVTFLNYLGEKIPQKYEDMLKTQQKPKQKGLRGLVKAIAGGVEGGEFEQTFGDAINQAREYGNDLEKALKIKEAHLEARASRLKNRIAKALYTGLFISTDDDYGKNAVEHDSSEHETIDIELTNATEPIRLLINHFWGTMTRVEGGIYAGLDMLERDAQTEEQIRNVELLRKMCEMKYGPRSAKAKMHTSEVGTSMERRAYYFMWGITRTLIGENVNSRLNYLYKKSGRDYNVQEAWNLLTEALPAFQRLSEIGIPRLIESYDAMRKQDKRYLKYDIREMIAEVTGESTGNEFQARVNEGVSKATEFVLRAGKKLDETLNGAEKYLS